MVGAVEHRISTLVGQRVFGIALGYEDLIDHDQLRYDPVMVLLAGKLKARRPECAPLADKSTLNRLEHAGVAGNNELASAINDRLRMRPYLWGPPRLTQRARVGIPPAQGYVIWPRSLTACSTSRPIPI